jgi:hypothetical protein
MLDFCAGEKGVLGRFEEVGGEDGRLAEAVGASSFIWTFT